MSNVCANETLDAMCCVCGAHCATWVGEDEHGEREYRESKSIRIDTKKHLSS